LHSISKRIDRLKLFRLPLYVTIMQENNYTAKKSIIIHVRDIPAPCLRFTPTLWQGTSSVCAIVQ